MDGYIELKDESEFPRIINPRSLSLHAPFVDESIQNNGTYVYSYVFPNFERYMCNEYYYSHCKISKDFSIHVNVPDVTAVTISTSGNSIFPCIQSSTDQNLWACSPESVPLVIFVGRYIETRVIVTTKTKQETHTDITIDLDYDMTVLYFGMDEETRFKIIRYKTLATTTAAVVIRRNGCMVIDNSPRMIASVDDLNLYLDDQY